MHHVFLRNILGGTVFFLSGCAALLYQVAWQRVLTQAIGVDSLSTALIVTIFMLGLGFGALYGGSVAERYGSRLPLLYCAMEVIIGVFGLVSVPLIRSANNFFAMFSGGIFFDFLVNTIVLILPTFVMGMTTPIIIEILKERLENFGRTIGCFYGLNVVGAALGSFGSFFTIELLGLRSTTHLAAGLNIGIGVLFYFCFIGIIKSAAKANVSTAGAAAATPANIEAAAPNQLDRSIPDNRHYYIASFIFGFSGLALQMIMLRIMTFILAPMPIIFSVGVGGFLVLMAIGQNIGGFLADKVNAEKRKILPLWFAYGAIVFSFLVLYVPLDVLDGFIFHSRNLPGPLTVSMVAVFVMLPVLFTSALLPTVSRLAVTDINKSGKTFGTILFYSTLGNIAGTFITAFILFEFIGSIISMYMVAAILLLGALSIKNSISISQLVTSAAEALCTAFVNKKWRDLSSWQWITVLLVAGFLIYPLNYYGQNRSYKYVHLVPNLPSKPTRFFEGHSSVMAMFIDEKNQLEYMRPFNTSAAAAIFRDDIIDYQYLLAPLMAVDKEFRPKKILYIGLGAGHFPYLAKEIPFLEKLTLVELTPEVIKGFVQYSHPNVAATMTHPKINLQITDGRRYVVKALSKGEKFDFIQVGISAPSLSGAANIYSSDFFASLKQLLNPGGYLAVLSFSGAVRLGYDYFNYAFNFSPQGWVFFSDKPFPITETTTIKVEPPISNFFWSGGKLANVTKAMTVKPPSNATPITLEVTIYDKANILKAMKDLTSNDDNVAFEYNYLKVWRGKYIWPGTNISTHPGVDRSNKILLTYVPGEGC